MINHRPSLPLVLIGSLLALPLLHGCASLGGEDAQADEAAAQAASTGGVPRSSGALPADEERSQPELNQILSEGYSQLYEAAGSLQYLDKALLLKVESDAVGAFADDASSYFSELSQTLEQLGEDYPGIALDNTGLPVLEQRKRDAASSDRLKSLAPVTGITGIEFERTLLLTLSGALNQLEFLAIVMQEEEKNDARIALLEDIQTNMRRLYDADVGLLEERYFVKE